MPDIAREKSKEGLEAFAQHLYALVNYAYETGDVGPLQAVSGPECTMCNFVITQVGDGFANDDWMAGAQISFKSASSTFVETTEGRYQAVVDIMQDDLEFYSPEGHLSTSQGPELSFAQLLECRYVDGSWVAEDVVTLGT